MPPKARKQSSSTNAGQSSASGASGDGGGRYRAPDVVIDEAWSIRTAAENNFNPKLEYGSSRYKFSLAVHHRGTFIEDKYVGGELNYVDRCTTLAFGLTDLSAIMLRLGYSAEYICEFYYAHPSQSHVCVGFDVGMPISPLLDEEHMKSFKKLASKFDKIVHLYVLEVTEAEALARLARDQQERLKSFYSPPSKGVVIEEIEEPPVVVPTQRPRKKAKVPTVYPGVPLLEWRERDIEFEKYLVDSLTESREQYKRAEATLEELCRRLSDEDKQVKNADKVQVRFFELHL